MHVTKLQLEDFGPHEKLSIDFRRGINCVIGPNGSGKSTILDALRFAFTNSVEAAGNKSENIRHGASSAKVVAHFVHRSERCHITRGITAGGNSTQRLVIGDADPITKAGEIQETLESMLGANTQTLLNNVFVGQGKIDTILFQRASDRLKEFQSTFGLDKAGKAVSYFGDQIKNYPVVYGLEAEVLTRESQLEEERAKLEVALEELASINKRLDKLRPEKDKAVRTLSGLAAYHRRRELEADIAEAEAEVVRREHVVDRTSKSVADLEDQQQKLDARALRDEKASLDDVRSYRQQLERLPDVMVSDEQEQQLTSLEQQLETAVERKRRADKLVADPAIRPADPAVDQADAEVRRLTGEIEAERQRPMQQQLQDLSAAAERAKEELESGSCHACHRPFEGHDEQAAKKALGEAEAALQAFKSGAYARWVEAGKELAQQLSVAKSAAEQARADQQGKYRSIAEVAGKSVDQSRAEFEALRDKLAESRRIHQQRSEIQAQLKTLNAPHDLDKALAGVSEKLDLLVSISSELKQLSSRLGDDQANLAQLRERLQRKVTQMEEEKTESEAAEGGQDEQELQKILDEYARSDERRVEVEREKSGAAREVRAIEDQLAELRQRQERQARDMRWVEICKEAQQALRPGGLPSLMMGEYARLVNERMAYYLSVWQSPFSMRISPEDSFEFIANKTGQDMVASRLSGGEKVVGSTSFRMAMADSFAAEVGLLVLDEPSVYLDKDNICHLQDLLVRLKEMSTASGRQIILVTHEESLLGFVDHAIELGR